jgi:hypothetical protein
VEAGERDRLARRLTFETGGSPFFATTLLAALQRVTHMRADLTAWPPPHGTLEAPLPFTLPDLVRSAILVRVAELDDDQRRVLHAASVGGLGLDLDLIATLTELPEPRVEDLLPELERHHLVRFDGDRYAFDAALIPEVIQAECLTRGQQQTLRARTAAALAGRPDLQARVQRAELLARARPGPEAFDEAVGVARDAHGAGAMRTARRALQAAERIAARESGTELGGAVAQLRAELERAVSG